MRTNNWLTFPLSAALLCATACGSTEDPGGSGSDLGTDTDRDEPGKIGDAGGKRDGGGKKDGGKKPPNSSDDDDEYDPDSGAKTCEKVRLPSDPVAPDILIVLDRSASMIGIGDPRNAGKNRWNPSVNAIKTVTSELTDTVGFGLMLFPRPGGVPVLAMCDPGQIDVPVARGSAADIGAMLDAAFPEVGATPTAASLAAARMELDKPCLDCAKGPAYVLLVTDGQPTCGPSGSLTTAPEDITATNTALDELLAADIKTYVIGYDTAADPASAATMDEFAMHGGTEKHLPVEDEGTLLAELTRIAGSLVPCEFELTSSDAPDPEYVRVEIDGTTYEFNKDWHLEGNKVVLTPEGGACPTLRDAKLHDLRITLECERIFVQ